MEPILTLGAINLPFFGLSLSLGFVVASFWFFKNAKDKFGDNDQLISFLVTISIGWFTGARLFFFLFNLNKFAAIWHILFPWTYPGLSFIGGILGIISILFYLDKKKEISLWRISNAATIPLLFYYFAYFSGQFLASGYSLYLILITIIFIIGLLSFWLERIYRSFTWYPSGKIGFPLLISQSLFLFIFGGLAFYLPHTLYLENVGAIIIAIIALIVLYQRSGRENSLRLEEGIQKFKEYFKK